MSKNTFSEQYSPSIPKPRTFSQTKAAPSMNKTFGPSTVARGTTGTRTMPLSVPRSGCCGKA